MNVVEIKPGSLGTLPQYFAVAFALAIITAWVFFAYQGRYHFEEGTSFIKRLGWPAYLLINMVKKKSYKNRGSYKNCEVISDEINFSHTEVKREYLRDNMV
jgi:hypothetical protein